MRKSFSTGATKNAHKYAPSAGRRCPIQDYIKHFMEFQDYFLNYLILILIDQVLYIESIKILVD